jgi:hypothetical protein
MKGSRVILSCWSYHYVASFAVWTLFRCAWSWCP